MMRTILRMQRLTDGVELLRRGHGLHYAAKRADVPIALLRQAARGLPPSASVVRDDRIRAAVYLIVRRGWPVADAATIAGISSQTLGRIARSDSGMRDIGHD